MVAGYDAWRRESPKNESVVGHFKQTSALELGCQPIQPGTGFSILLETSNSKTPNSRFRSWDPSPSPFSTSSLAASLLGCLRQKHLMLRWSLGCHSDFYIGRCVWQIQARRSSSRQGRGKPGVAIMHQPSSQPTNQPTDQPSNQSDLNVDLGWTKSTPWWRKASRWNSGAAEEWGRWRRDWRSKRSKIDVSDRWEFY